MAERAAVNRQVLGSIPSGGAYFFVFFAHYMTQAERQMATAVRTLLHTGGSSAVEQRTVKCVYAYAVILWSGVQISPPGFFVFLFFAHI